jgi:hypothetical protein
MDVIGLSGAGREGCAAHPSAGDIVCRRGGMWSIYLISVIVAVCTCVWLTPSATTR